MFGDQEPYFIGVTSTSTVDICRCAGLNILIYIQFGYGSKFRCPRIHGFVPFILNKDVTYPYSNLAKIQKSTRFVSMISPSLLRPLCLTA